MCIFNCFTESETEKELKKKIKTQVLIPLTNESNDKDDFDYKKVDNLGKKEDK